MCYLLKYLLRSIRGSVLRHYYYTFVTEAMPLACDVK